MTAFVVSFVVVALAEIGDKTQLIAFSLASRYRRPWTVMAGIFVATVANHGLASALGVWGASRLSEPALGWILGLGFVAFGAWTLVPDTASEPAPRRWGPLVSTATIFFFAEMGDKTQLATVALGARFASMAAVTAGTTLGMLAADALAVFAGIRLAAVLPLPFVRRLAAALFFLFGAAAILRALGVV